MTVAGLAGCIGGSDETDPGSQAVAVVEEFYAAYNNANLERANELAREEDPRELAYEDFERFGGLDNMSWTINGTETPRESTELVEVHADVTVTTPDGTFEGVDYFLMLPEDGDWRFAAFLAQPVRDQMNQTAIDEAMRRG
jgi:hypothetical protein